MDWIDLAEDRDRWQQGICKYGNETSGSIKCGKSLDQLRTSWLLNKGSAPWSKQVNN